MDDDDLIELKALFLDECLENIELLEQGLMRMGDGEDDADTLNDVFRAAHSIKGGAATFGYVPMSELTHHMETLLDEMRSGRRPVEDTDVELLLRALDLVQNILQGSRESDASDHPERAALQTSLQASVERGAGASPAAADERDGAGVDGLVAGGGSPDASGEAVVGPDATANVPPWRIRFEPARELMRRGNEPLLLLRELARLGECALAVDASALPVWDDYDPGACYLAWDVTLAGGVAEADIAEVFEWVEGECTLNVSRAVNDGAPSAFPDAGPTISAPEPDSPPPSTAGRGDGETGGSGPKPAARATGGGGSTESSSIRIATDKIDQLIDLVGELVITQSMLTRVGGEGESVDLEALRERLVDLEHNTRDLQESVMQVRMLPLSSAFSRLPRLVRDLSRKLDKRVDLVLEGGATELDKTVLERMIDPLVHLVRNALDHGLETPEARRAAGKPETGVLRLDARQESGSVIIEIVDDGRGIDSEVILRKAREKGIVVGDETPSEEQVHQLIFAPGFSTAEAVSDVSGRGVGMDVVRSNIVELNGRVSVSSALGVGTTIRIELPLSLAILDGQLVRIADQAYVIPILSIIETLEMAQAIVASIPGTGEVCRFRGAYLPMIRLDEHLGTPERADGRLVVVVDTPGQRAGLVIDEVVGQQQVVVKPLDKNYRQVEGLAGATIMSDGSVSLILDPSAITAQHLRTHSRKDASPRRKAA